MSECRVGFQSEASDESSITSNVSGAAPKPRAQTETPGGAVVSWLPRAGLGNKLFSWSKGLVFAHLNELPHYMVFWTHFSYRLVMPEGRRRPNYGRALRESSIWRQFGLLRYVALPRVHEPPLNHLNTSKQSLYVFSRRPKWHDPFRSLKPHRALVRSAFSELWRPAAEVSEDPVIALHVRLGDFKTVDSAKPFERQGLTRTPTDYFVTVVNTLRLAADYDVPVSIFSDGDDTELAPLLALPCVSRYHASTDAHEMAALSRAAVIVMSASSSFSWWASFLSNAIVIHHPSHYHAVLREPADDVPWEGQFDAGDQAMLAAVTARVGSRE
ncbi:MAG: hypothetical protein AAGB04_01825 [Pseudomonadota bacterium]